MIANEIISPLDIIQTSSCNMKFIHLEIASKLVVLYNLKEIKAAEK